MSLRALIRRLAGSAGLFVVSNRHAGRTFLEHPPRTAFDLVLLHCYPQLTGLNFIQIGANDGQRADPLLPYLGPNNWSGLMFEPLRVNFTTLSQRHGANPRLRLRQRAVDASAGRRMIYDVDRTAQASLPDWAYGLASFSRERVLQAVTELGLDERAIVSEEVVTVSWDEVWADFGQHRCDLLVLDTEGYDLALLRTASLAQHRPRIIHFEHACVSAPERLEFYGQLLALGYELSTDGPDTTAWLPT